MHSSLNFLAGLGSTFGLIETTNFLPGNNPVLDNVTTWDELLKALISIVGGILSTVIINLLRKQFPDLFTKKRNKRGKLE